MQTTIVPAASRWPIPGTLLVVLLTFALTRSVGAQGAAASDSAAVVAVVQRLFDAMARRDTTAARALLLPGSQFISIRSAAPGAGSSPAMPRRQADTTFLRSLAAGRERLLERFWAPVVHVHGPLATVWTPYDFHTDGKFSHCGIDSFNLLRTPAGWQIAGIVYTVESTGCAPSPLGAPR
jgi:hypothetical protein